MVAPKKTSTKTTQPAETAAPKTETKAPVKGEAAKAVAGEQLTLVDALPVAAEPPAAAAPAPKKLELEKAAPAPESAPRATRPSPPKTAPSGRDISSWWFRLDLNQRHKALQASALPTELQNHTQIIPHPLPSVNPHALITPTRALAPSPSP